jgi:hypothetical protein
MQRLRHYANPLYSQRFSDAGDNGIQLDSFFRGSIATFGDEWIEVQGDFTGINANFELRYSQRNNFVAFKGVIWTGNGRWDPITTSVAVSGINWLNI